MKWYFEKKKKEKKRHFMLSFFLTFMVDAITSKPRLITLPLLRRRFTFVRRVSRIIYLSVAYALYDQT